MEKAQGNEGDALDLGDVAFGHGTGTTLSYAANEAGSGYVGTDLKSVPIVSDGANSAQIALQGQYTTAGFEGTYDQGSGTAVAYDTAHESENFDQLVLGGEDSFIEGDKIDLSALIDIATGKNVTDYVEVTQSGSDITVRVDLNGGGSFDAGASDLCTITGIGTDGADPLTILIDGEDHLFTV